MDLLRIEDLYVYFPIKRGLFGHVIGYVKAVDGVSFTLNKCEGLALVGETGSGKSTILRVILKLQKPTKGRVFYDGKEIFSLSKPEENWYRRKVQAVFQNPFQSLNPRMRVYDIIAEPIKKYMNTGENEIKKKVEEVINLVGLPLSLLNQYPANLSGGQAQRIAIARAIAVNPELILLDEPTSALDVSVQAQILSLLQDLSTRLNVTYLLVTHDLSIVNYIAKRIVVLYRGNIMESGSVEDVFKNPLHPYTQTLIMSIPDPFFGITGLISSLSKEEVFKEINGCKFAYRCPYAMNKCYEKRPSLISVQDRLVSCLLYE